ncbi:MAG: prepilin-type N-terminal cleavage/methylation domain-containing protein [Chthoniobacteraceae bacterium]
MTRRRGTGSGFTLIELLVVVAIIAVLAVLSVGAFNQIRGRTERINCTGNLRNLYAGLSSYLTQFERWPQSPHKLQDEKYDEWWIDELRKVGISEKTWQCPTLLREMQTGTFSEAQSGGRKPPARKIHYMPTPFDEQPSTPRKWPTQPWLIEIFSGHGNGALMIFPDGSVMAYDEFQRAAR